MKSMRKLAIGCGLAGWVTVCLFAGCKIDSADSVSRNVGINVQGVYSGNGGPLVRQNTGAPISSLNVIQDGSRLQAVDNNGLLFRGNISEVRTGEGQRAIASFTLNGTTTDGAEGLITGSISVQNNTATMQGSWAEASLFSTVQGTASVVVPPSNGTTPPGNDNGNGNDNAGTAPEISFPNGTPPPPTPPA